MKESYNYYMQMVRELRKTSSSKDKIFYIKHFYEKEPLIKKILNYAYDPFKVYGLTSKNMRLDGGNRVANDVHFKEFLNKLDELHARSITGNQALDYINSWVDLFYPDYAVELLNILDRDIRCGVSATTINKAIPNCITVFKVPLAKKFIDRKQFDAKEIPFRLTYVSRKLDGVRCVVIKEDGKAKTYSRLGKEFHTLQKIIDEVESWKTDNFILDGEVCLMDEDGDENFQGIMKEIRRKYHTIENPLYYVFDGQSLNTFLNGSGEPDGLQYCLIYPNLEIDIKENCKYIKVLEQHKVESFTELMRLFYNANNAGWEGLMLRNGEAKYEAKRTVNLLKWKKMQDEEFEVIGAIEGNGKYLKRLGAIIIDYDGYKVQVGSGFSDEDRLYYWDLYKQELIPAQATVQFFEKTKDKDGNKSLRFPVFKCFIEDESDEGDLLLI